MTGFIMNAVRNPALVSCPVVSLSPLYPKFNSQYKDEVMRLGSLGFLTAGESGGP